MEKKTFESWMKNVDQIITATIGLSALDLPDVCYADWFENGMSAKAAARKAIKNAGE